jgi:cytochrome bd-type quinol oxidase subunit 1
VSTAYLWISVLVFFAVYATLGTIDLLLMLRYARKELPAAPTQTADEPVPAMQY